MPLGTEEPYYSIRITHGFLFVVGIPKPIKPRLCVAKMIPPTANFEFTETTVRILIKPRVKLHDKEKIK